MVTGGNGVKDGSDVGLGDKLHARARSTDIVEQSLDEGSSGLAVISGLHVR